MNRFYRMAAVTVAVLVSATVVSASPQASPLARFDIDPVGTSVSGLSSGGFMAVQMHVIHSATFRAGAGVVAGGPYLCAEGAAYLATGRCMAHNASIPVDSLAETTRTWAREGRIDPVSNLRTSRLYLFSGTQDPTVRPAVMDDLQSYYLKFVPPGHVDYNRTVPAGHAMVTEHTGAACSVTDPPYINDCDFDLAGAILKQLHGPLQPRNDGPLAGRFIEFDQSAFVTGHGMAPTGWLFVPQDCATGARCRLHVVFHGCHQNAATVGERYVRTTGYARWADTNRIVLLFPQTGSSAANGCWDWWGYDSPLYAQKTGPQVRAVKAMVDRLRGGALPPMSVCISALNSAHVAAGRAIYWWGMVLAAGSREPLGWPFSSTTLKEVGPGVFESGVCP